MSNPMIRGFAHVATTLATVAIVAFVALSGVLAGGNNGTLKIHDLGSPSGTPNNEPKVCTFNVEAFNLDEGQGGYLVFSTQGGDLPANSDVTVAPAFLAPASATGYAVSTDINVGGVEVPFGHWKATLYGKQLPSGELVDVKAKSKVFKVTCNDTGGGGGGIGG